MQLEKKHNEEYVLFMSKARAGHKVSFIGIGVEFVAGLKLEAW